jgi:hypothetical protein|uniref:Uncharacterized protein n=1 Tax=viral metagenome TaxID=1070528 RepID=A0A6C0BEI8_9ZZZZ
MGLDNPQPSILFIFGYNIQDEGSETTMDGLERNPSFSVIA